MRLPFTSLLALLAFDAQAQVTTPPPPAQQVVISGGKTDVEAGRDFVAGKIVIGKERILEAGVPTTGELLRREPAISVGKNGSIGLLGMPGYTQILVDGAPYTGDALALDLVHVERIEIIKTTTAATGPYGIAGTINIVRKGVQRQSQTTLRAGASATGGRVGADLAWTNNQANANAPFGYNLRLSARHMPARSERTTVATLAASGRPAQPYYTGEREGRTALRFLTASAEVSWLPSAGHKLSFSPDLGEFREMGTALETRAWPDGRRLALDQGSSTRLASLGLPLRWNWTIDDDTSLAVRAQLNRARIDPAASTREARSGAPLRVRRSDGETATRSQFLDIDYNTVLGKHEIAAGAKLGRNRSETDYLDLVDGRQDPSLAVLGLASASRTDRRRLFVQDDWRIDPTLSVNLGASAEHNSYRL
jgi:outer membrane receptor for ferrienterochelin and colicin